MIIRFRRTARLLLSAALLLCLSAHAAEPLVYRGQLLDAGAPANGRYDLEFRVHGGKDQPLTMVGPVVVAGVQVTDGAFAVTLPIEDALLPADGWVAVAVRDAGSEAGFDALPGLQPYTLKAASCPASWEVSGNAGLAAGNFLGTTDAVPLELRTANRRGLRLEATANNTITTTGGAAANAVTPGARGGTVSGGGVPGQPNLVTDIYGTVSGGVENQAGIDDGNTSNQAYATVSGGFGNDALAAESTIAGGSSNSIAIPLSVIGGGRDNTITGGSCCASTIGGGFQNTISAIDAVIPGGAFNEVHATGGFAAGRRARVLAGHNGSFAWADQSLLDVNWNTSGPNQFLIRAAGGVGIGTESPQNALHVVGDISSAGVAAHVAQIQNLSSGTSPDVLALRVGTAGNPGGGVNFITFFGATSSLGAIQGNGSGSVVLAGAGSDYAEYLPKLDATEAIAPGEVLGVFHGRVSRRTDGAELVMVASSGAIVAGNDPGEDARDGYVLTAFVGQAELRVRGAVAAGDYLLPSGDGDGLARARAADALTAAELPALIGRVWTVGAVADGLTSVRASIGLARTDGVAARLLDAQQRTLASVRSESRRLADENAALHARLGALEAEQLAQRQQYQAQAAAMQRMLTRMDALLLPAQQAALEADGAPR